MESNRKESFKKAGLEPTDKNQIKNRLPNWDESETNTDLSIIGDEFFQRLQEKRSEYVTRCTTKHKKLQVPPGQSVCLSFDIPVEKIKHQEKGQKKKVSSKTTKTTHFTRTIGRLHIRIRLRNQFFDQEVTTISAPTIVIRNINLSTCLRLLTKPVSVTKFDLEIGKFALVKWNEDEYPWVVFAIELEGWGSTTWSVH